MGLLFREALAQVFLSVFMSAGVEGRAEGLGLEIRVCSSPGIFCIRQEPGSRCLLFEFIVPGPLDC